jgi:beta-glucosidase
LREEAVAAAQKADVVVACVGLSPELEGEEMPLHVEGFAGGDRTDIKLPAAQRELLEAVAATGKPVVVVLMNGSAVAVDWAQQHAGAILEAWYPGEAGGTAIAEALAGKINPGGKLPITFYSNVSELPSFTDYSMKNRTYRYYTGKPLFGFGYGLSYTHFQFSQLKLSSEQVEAGQPLTVEGELRNTGSMAGDEVAELYLAPPKTDVSPRTALTAFERVHLAPGESKHVRFDLSPRQLSVVDDQGKRAVTAGSYTVYLGGGQPDEAQDVTAHFSIEGHQELPR